MRSTSLSDASKKAVNTSKSLVIQNELPLLKFQNHQGISASEAPDESVSDSLLDSSLEQLEVTHQASESAIAQAPTCRFAHLEEKLPIIDAINLRSSGLDTSTEPSQANAKSDLPNELLNESFKTDVQTSQLANQSESSNESLNNESLDEIQAGVDNLGESLTTAQLALLIGVGDRSVFRSERRIRKRT
ncbi:hypothetical protein [Crinalium epipsammum]|uniref:hypothetical protein n=1 Tax=Crinalium epipsammum TaxID=241425 RepID=UPI00059B5607|nr:hypothetical protein [Crinalium epipsammum]